MLILCLLLAVLFAFVLDRSKDSYSSGSEQYSVGLGESYADETNKIGIFKYANDVPSAEDSRAMAPSGSEQKILSPGDKGTERLVIKTATLTMVVQDVAKAVSAISSYAETKGGFIISSELYETGSGLSGSVSVRIPADFFDSGLGDVKGFGEVKSQTLSGQDVTEEFVDLSSQLKNLRATEEQFLEIMKKAEKIEDILAVQRELSTVRSQIELIQGRMKFLQQSAALSTITVYLSTDPSALPVIDNEDQWKPWGTLKEAARSLLDTLKWYADGLIWVLVYVPVALLYLGFFALLYWVGRKVYVWYIKMTLKK